jgi:hypothetical protein
MVDYITPLLTNAKGLSLRLLTYMCGYFYRYKIIWNLTDPSYAVMLLITLSRSLSGISRVQARPNLIAAFSSLYSTLAIPTEQNRTDTDESDVACCKSTPNLADEVRGSKNQGRPHHRACHRLLQTDKRTQDGQQRRRPACAVATTAVATTLSGCCMSS